MKNTNDMGREVESAVSRQAAEWFVANREGALSPGNRAAFTTWLRTSPIHVREYLAVSSMAKDLGGVRDAGAQTLPLLIERARLEGDGVVSLAARTNPASTQPSGQTMPARRLSRPRRWNLAASAAAVFVVAGFIAQQQGVLSSISRSNGNDTLATAHGEQRIWRLPDGSVMRLNSGSGLKVRFTDTERVVEIRQGQALFEVAKDAARPFRVRARDTEVLALGTSFEVYCKPESTVVTVVTGKVAVYRSDPAASMIRATPLGPGEQLDMAAGKPQPAVNRVDVARTVAWTQQQIMFEQERLGDVALEFNRYGRMPLVIEGEALNELRITGIFSAYDTDSFIGFLGRLPGVVVETRDGKTTVRKDSGT